jgi:hypothetical protein
LSVKLVRTPAPMLIAGASAKAAEEKGAAMRATQDAVFSRLARELVLLNRMN